MSVVIKAERSKTINYAAFKNKRQELIGEIKVEGMKDSSSASGKCVCRITAVPEFFYEYKTEFEWKQNSITIPAPDLILNDIYYRHELIEAKDGEMKIEIYDPNEPEKILGFLNQTIHIEPYMHWDGREFPYTAPAFMQPNDPLITKVLKRAGELAADAGISLSAYQTNSEASVLKQAECIFNALKEVGIVYISSPASFEESGQKVRSSHQILNEENHQGNCLDLSLLYAACLEAASIHAVLIVTMHHAFCGIWLNEYTLLPSAFMRNGEIDTALSDKILKKMVPVECTTFTQGHSADFSQSVEIGRKNMKDMEYMIDVLQSRNDRIFPIYTYTETHSEMPPTVQPAAEPFVYHEADSKPKSPIELLRAQVMDISAKNKLLNHAANCQEIRVPVDTKAIMIQKEPVEPIQDPNFRQLYSRSRENERQTGRKDLYFTINVLNWQQSDTSKSCQAPLYLCPAEIVRDARGDYHMKIDYEGMVFNPVLKVMMFQKYQLDTTPILDRPCEQYREQKDYLEFLIEKLPGWSIQEDIGYIAMYHIPNEAIWMGLQNENVLLDPVVKGILDGEMNWDNVVDVPEELDENFVLPFEMDSSQKQIMDKMKTQKCSVVVGPPGNGKTQVVTNMIIQTLRKGSVLFVSEKLSAMQVVADKLDTIFPGIFKLMVVSNKTTAADVMQQIKRTLEYIEMPDAFQTLEHTDAIQRKYIKGLQYLEKYYDTMEEKNICGKTLSELIHMVENEADGSVFLVLNEEMAHIPLADVEDRIPILVNVIREYQRCKGKYSEYIDLKYIPETDPQEWIQRANEAVESFDQIIAGSDLLSSALHLSPKKNTKAYAAEMTRAAYILKDCPNRTAADDLPDEEELEAGENYKEAILNSLEAWLDARTKKKKIEKIDQLASVLNRAYSPKKARKLMASIDQDLEAFLYEIRNTQYLCDAKGHVTVPKAQASVETYIEKKAAKLAKLPEDIKNAVECCMLNGIDAEIRQCANAIAEHYIQYTQAAEDVSKGIIRNEHAFLKAYPDVPKIELIREWLKMRNLDNRSISQIYTDYCQELEEQGYGSLIDQIRKIMEKDGSDLGSTDFVRGYDRAWALYQIDAIRQKMCLGMDYNTIIFDERLKQIEECEEQLRKDSGQAILQSLLHRVPDIREGVKDEPEYGILQGLIRKKKTSIRKLFEMAPNMLKAICPVMIMDPAAAAEYITDDFPKFDLVLIDEGSQMPLYNALIPISKGDKCVIFGDEKQLQPAETFQTKISEDFDTPVEKTSILTEAYKTAMPRTTLRFHYRSQYESLMAFSNKYFYNGDIVTFPTNDTCQKQGVSYEFVEGGIYDREKTKANRKEAERVVEKIQEIYEGLPDDTEETVGVITLNVHQMAMIQSLLMKEIRSDTAMGEKVDTLTSVVNLQACQGKEWDHVILSPGFGYDLAGNFSAGFGALNQEYGENRLNVMLTRARKEMIVITSIEPDMLRSAKSSGVQKFLEFLRYAKGETSMKPDLKKNREGLSKMQMQVAEMLRQNGYEVHTHIGSSACQIDMGIVSKKDPDHYAMGILFDHFKDPAATVYDREIVYPKVLKKKGWNIYRLRELNWFNDREYEIRQILRKLEAWENE